MVNHSASRYGLGRYNPALRRLFIFPCGASTRAQDRTCVATTVWVYQLRRGLTFWNHTSILNAKLVSYLWKFTPILLPYFLIRHVTAPVHVVDNCRQGSLMSADWLSMWTWTTCTVVVVCSILRPVPIHHLFQFQMMTLHFYESL